MHLPVHDALPALKAALERSPNAVLVAPPGAGKTTTVPLALLDAPWRGPQERIVMLEPRRIAARAAASRMASLLGEAPGGRVGYRTRTDSAISAATRIEVITEGLLVRRLLADPTLAGVACVILDEIHERSADADLALAFCLDLQKRLRPELRLLAMSATLDAARLSALMGAEVIESAGRMFEVEIRQARSDPPHLRDLPDRLAAAIREVLGETKGSVLAFLPGRGEIARTQAALSGCGVEVLPLHGELSAAEQDRALTDTGRRVVLATSIAETSLTVPGVRVVVDGGWRRSPRFDPGSGLSRLTTLRVSRAAADQRAGRAGREAPGLAIRLWTAATQRALAPHDRPKLLDADLAGPALDIAAWCREWGSEPDALVLPDTPPPGAWAAARALLVELEALDGDGAISATGRAMASLGAHPRLAAMMLAATTPPEKARAAELAALLEERDPIRPGRDRRGLPVAPPAEIGLRLELIAGSTAAGETVDRGALSRIRDGAARYRRRLGVPERLAGLPGSEAGLLAAAFPDRIAQARGEPGSYRLWGGGGAKLPALDPLARASLMVAAGLHVRQSTQIVLAAALEPEALPASLLARASTQDESSLDPVSGAVLNRRRVRLGALVLSDRTLPADPAQTALILARAALARPGVLDWNEAARQMQARVSLARRFDPSLPDLSDEALAADPDWLAPHLHGITRLTEVGRVALAPILRGMLERAAAAALDRDLPPALTLAGERRVPIDYTRPVPTASAKAQTFYGMRQLPKLMDGRVGLQVELLSPAGRPCAITSDLAGFWTGAWGETRREMRGRYPRHDWPENPALGGTPRG
ncbi:ATP-dependent helicase HrpB [Endobacter medicaginis]|uniref:ATP-dependent helicase HrpB n=3 Tax=Endobacter medicaginis TaxID=1181271 RepID=A0A839V3A3_9PROT|nr:ATP-dependent helicase HrpB [Endobacter medicaginis]MBB3174052.1 ATP-dependent helicase HrpB [Endobacter medicaginis]MCX5476050.1 ATP-dependent helicase HrpB [Endobacter medicaginis]